MRRLHECLKCGEPFSTHDIPQVCFSCQSKALVKRGVVFGSYSDAPKPDVRFGISGNFLVRNTPKV